MKKRKEDTKNDRRLNLYFNLDNPTHKAVYDVLINAHGRNDKVRIIYNSIFENGSAPAPTAMPTQGTTLSATEIDAIVNRRVVESVVPILKAIEDLGRKIDSKTLVSGASAQNNRTTGYAPTTFDIPDVPDAALAGLDLFKSN